MLALLVFTSAGTGAESSRSGHLDFSSRVQMHADTLWQALPDNYPHAQIILNSAAGTDQMLQAADVVELGLHDARDACDKELLNLLPVYRDNFNHGLLSGEYIPNSIQPCAIGHSLWADVAVYADNSFVTPPELVSDFFNTIDFPGKRVLKRSPKVLAEWVMLESGVPVDKIYQALVSDEAWTYIERSLQKLDGNVLWVDTDAEALALIDAGIAAFAVVSNQSIIRKAAHSSAIVASRNAQYNVMWHGAIAHMNMLAVPKGAAASKAWELIEYITEPSRNLRASTMLGYSPVRTDQSALIRDQFKRLMPDGTQLSHVVWGNERWWREHGELLTDKLNDFLDARNMFSSAFNTEKPDKVLASNL